LLSLGISEGENGLDNRQQVRGTLTGQLVWGKLLRRKDFADKNAR
jgi:hypothetical protein